jgi:hypothetical protein
MIKKQTRKSTFSQFVFCLTFVLITTSLLTDTVQALEIKYPVSCFTSEELIKVREWEKTWVGKKIEKKNIDQVAEFLPPGILTLYKDTTKWGAPPGEPYFFIVPYEQYIQTKSVIAATKKYAPLARIDDQRNLENYTEIAGVPFPSPKTGLEIAWNFDLDTIGDSWTYFRTAPNITPAKMDRTMKSDYTKLFFIHRTDIEPIPKIEKNPKGIHHGLFMHLYDPPENKNSRFFNVRYIDPNKGDDGYIYYAPFRRMQRMGAATRSDTIDGSDLIYDDVDQWDGHILRNTYKYVGKKELLCSRRDDFRKWKRIEGQVMPTGMSRERFNLLVVEVKSNDSNYIYGKRVWYVDPESSRIVWQDIYDELGRYWKLYEYSFGILKTTKGEPKMFPIVSINVDLQRIHGSVTMDEVKGIGLSDVSPSLFTIRSIQQFSY